MFFFYIRHGDPIYNPDSLTELGHSQAEALADRLAVGGLDKIYSSSSDRAVMTAEPTARRLGLDITRLDWAHETLAMKDFILIEPETGRRNWCFLNRETLARFNSPEIRSLGYDWADHEYFSSTTYREGFKRIADESDRFFAELGFVHDADRHDYLVTGKKYDRVALFAHAGFGMEFLSNLLDIPYPMYCLHFDHQGLSTMTVIYFPDDGERCVPQVLEYANDSHLFKAGVDPKNHLGVF